MRINRVADDTELREAENLLLTAVPTGLRAAVHSILTNPRCGCRGLRAWVARLEVGPRGLPAEVPAAVVEVYLTDDDDEPLHDCGECGLPVPDLAGRRSGHEPTCDRVYFAACPACGGRTGPHAFWSRAGAATAN